MSMENVKVLNEKFDWPKGEDLEKMRKIDLSLFRPTGKESMVQVMLRQPALDRYKHLLSGISAPKGGWVTAVLPSSGPDWVARHFLPALGDVQILGPEPFRQAWLNEIKAVKSLYK
jgi:predicted DNA-binding transcriptional regulator YafY